MYSLLSLTAVSLLLTQTTLAQFDLQSPAFNLELLSEDPTLDGAFLDACHSGAALETLCVLQPGQIAADVPEVFYFNTSSSDDSSDAVTEGLVIYNLIYNDDLIESEPLTVYAELTDTLADQELTPSETGTALAFDDDEFLYIPDYDEVTGAVTSLYNW
ncbi:hypothetical protein LTR62_002074 [Meristemomyces frigidus]|uniref:Uncharacterized protein n=1 Tax=Meristemomyces frigidus TaxID=1508187 RepID=A0AAN7TS00_9PEZI|nr:hypothetical protein LTR62_002074 [Meristemomyces frigidus]